jgi:predicted nucleic acid-binding protein
MRLVIDANIVVAALLKDATTREVLLKENIELFAPECLSIEIKDLLANTRIRKRIKLKDKDLNDLTSAVLSRITFFPEKSFISSIKQSISLVTHIEDAPYIALSLALKIPLWSNDSELKEQSLVKIFTTHELLKILRI